MNYKKLPKTLTTVTALSKIIALMFFLAFPIIGFFLGAGYQKHVQDQGIYSLEQKNLSKPTPTPPDESPVVVPHPTKEGWARFVSPEADYYLDFPKKYILRSTYAKGYELHVDNDAIDKTNSYSNIGFYYVLAPDISQEWIAMLKNIPVGGRVDVDPDDELLNQFSYYERLPDKIYNGTLFQVYVNRNPWESTLHHYVLLHDGKKRFTITAHIANHPTEVLDISYEQLQAVLASWHSLE